MTVTSYSAQNANQPWSLTYPNSSTLDFELRPQDHWGSDYSGSVQRTEIALNKVYAPNTPMQITYGFKVEPGPATTTGWMTLGQMHSESEGPSPFWISLDHEHLEIYAAYGNGANNRVQWIPWTDPNPIQRDHTYSIQIDMNLSNTSAGYLHVWLDGVQIVDYNGPVGYGDDVYWKMGIYRPNAQETISVDYSNLKIVTPTSTDTLTPPDPTQVAGTPPPPPPPNHLPLISSNAGGATASVSVAENTTAVTKVVATDSDTGQTLAYSIVPVASGGGADASKFVIDATTGALAFKTAPNFEAPTDALAAANVYDVTVQVSDNKGGIDKQAIAVTVTDQPETPPPPPPAPGENVVFGSRGDDHLTGGDGNDKLYGGRGNDVLVGHSGNDVLWAGSGQDILIGGPGNDKLNGDGGNDYLLLDGTMQDYTFGISKSGTTLTNSVGEVDTFNGVEVLHFSDGTNYLIQSGKLVQTSDPNINQFLADAGVDQSYFNPVATVATQQQLVQLAAPASSDPGTGAAGPIGPQQASSNSSTIADNADREMAATSTPQHNDVPLAGLGGHALSQTVQTKGLEKLLDNAALWNAVDAASNTPTHADKALADLKQQLPDTFEHNGANDTVHDLAALLHLTHHE